MQLKEIEKIIIDRTITKITSLATSIRSYCFSQCDALTDISFPNATSIGSYAFSSCDALTTADFPNATSIGGHAFHNCPALTDVSFPNATSIGSYAFYDCAALTDISFPNATSIAELAFASCTNLNLHLYTGIDSISNIGETAGSVVDKPPKAVYFHYNEADEVLFSPADAIGQGNSKGTITYNIYTDNTIIKDGVLSKADHYTIVNVKHLDGSDWV